MARRAPLRVAFCSAKGLALAGGGGFTVEECHLDLEGRASVLSALRCHPLAARLASITVCDWSVAKEEVLQYIQDACNEGACPPTRSPSASCCPLTLLVLIASACIALHANHHENDVLQSDIAVC